jgi:hypothetical protein
VELIVHRGTCRTDACGTVTYFSHVRDLGAAKWVRFENKKTTLLILKIVLKRLKIKKIMIYKA